MMVVPMTATIAVPVAAAQEQPEKIVMQAATEATEYQTSALPVAAAAALDRTPQHLQATAGKAAAVTVVRAQTDHPAQPTLAAVAVVVEHRPAHIQAARADQVSLSSDGADTELK